MTRNNETQISKLEKGRAEFAYQCVLKVYNPHKDKNTFKVLKEFLKKDLDRNLKNKEISEEKIVELLSSAPDYLKKSDYDSLSKIERKVIDYYKKLNENYRSYAKKLPQMILSNGLGQSLAFIFSKKKDGNAYDLLYKHISEYMESDNTIRISKDKEKDIVEWVISLDSLTYRYATEEILVFLNWLRRFAEGMIEMPQGDKNENKS